MDGIKLCGIVLQKSKSKKEKFCEIYKNMYQWKYIEHCTVDNFHGMSLNWNNSENDYIPTFPPSKLCLPSIHDVTRCSHNLRHGKYDKEEENGDTQLNSEVNKLFALPNIVQTIPRSYQIAAYLQALVNDQIIVLPTGSDKYFLRDNQNFLPKIIKIYRKDIDWCIAFCEASNFKPQTIRVFYS